MTKSEYGTAPVLVHERRRGRRWPHPFMSSPVQCARPARAHYCRSRRHRTDTSDYTPYCTSFERSVGTAAACRFVETLPALSCGLGGSSGHSYRHSPLSLQPPAPLLDRPGRDPRSGRHLPETHQPPRAQPLAAGLESVGPPHALHALRTEAPPALTAPIRELRTGSTWPQSGREHLARPFDGSLTCQATKNPP